MKVNSNHLILTIDAGSSFLKVALIDKTGNIISKGQQEINNIYSINNYVEQNPIEILNSLITAIKSTCANIDYKQIKGVGITNQRETIVLWNKATGMPVYNAISWQDKRTTVFCDELIKKGYEQIIKTKTGLVINPYFSATKIKWILENVPKAQELLKENNLLCGTIDTWLLWNLSKEKSFYTDVSNASRTMLFNLKTLDWDEEILKLFNIPIEILPEIKPSQFNFGHLNEAIFAPSQIDCIPIKAMIGDQQASLLGQCCFEKFDVKTTYGTGCFSLMNIGEEPIFSNHNLLITVAWQFENKKPIYAIEGSVFIAGAAIKWLKDGLSIIYRADEIDYYAKISKHANEVYVVPSFVGLGAPYWDLHSRGAIFGIEANTNREDIVTATLNSIAYQCNDLLEVMAKEIGKQIKFINVDGGITSSQHLMQFQADIANLEVRKHKSVDVTILGIGYLTGLSVGIWKDFEEIKNINANLWDVFKPKITNEQRKKLIKGWNEAVSRTRNWKESIK